MDRQLSAAGVLLGLGVLLALLNWASVVVTWRSGRFHSAVPLVGGRCLGLGAGLLPPLRPYAWAVPFLDYGTIVFVLGLPRFAHEVWATSRLNLVEEYVGVRGRTTVRVRLFRRATTGWSAWAGSVPGSGRPAGWSFGTAGTRPSWSRTA